MGRFLFLQTLHLNIVRNFLFLSKKFDIQEYNKLLKQLSVLIIKTQMVASESLSLNIEM